MATADGNITTISTDKDMKISTFEDSIKSTFKEDFSDEIDDCNKYIDLSKKAKEHGRNDLANDLSLIAWDEYTHAKCLHMWLVEWGCDINEKDLIKWHELKDRVERFFHRQ